MQWRLILILFLMVLVVFFSLANASPVEFGFLQYKTDVSLALVIIVSALVGAIAGVVAGLATQLQLSRQLSEKEAEVRELKRTQSRQSAEEPPGGHARRGPQVNDDRG